MEEDLESQTMQDRFFFLKIGSYFMLLDMGQLYNNMWQLDWYVGLNWFDKTTDEDKVAGITGLFCNTVFLEISPAPMVMRNTFGTRENEAFCLLFM